MNYDDVDRDSHDHSNDVENHVYDDEDDQSNDDDYGNVDPKQPKMCLCYLKQNV